MKTIKLLIGIAVAALALGVAIERADASFFHKCPPPPPKEIILQVCHPCTGCTYNVPVCVPACCCGAPTVCFKDTLIGYGKVVFEWDCGHRVVVRFPPGGGYRVIG
jgi:hypothetical protein